MDSNLSLITNSSAWASEEHKMFANSTRKLFDAEMAPNIEKWAEQGIVDRDFWKTVGQQGVMGGSISEEYGGFGGGIGFDAITVYEQGRTGDTGWGYGIQSIVIHYIYAYGSEEQKKKWLPKLVSGDSVAAIAMTEPGTGSDLQNVQTHAEKDGNHYKINGSKIFITNGHTADLVVVVAKTDRSAGAKGVSLIVLETEDAVGFRRGRNLKKLGMKGSDTADCVEKLRISDAVIFRKEPVKLESRMISAMRRIELAHERQMANWAEPFASRNSSRCTDKNFADFAKNGVFQQNRPSCSSRMCACRRRTCLAQKRGRVSTS